MSTRIPRLGVGLLMIAAGLLAVTGADIVDVWQWFAAGIAAVIGLAGLVWAGRR